LAGGVNAFPLFAGEPDFRSEVYAIDPAKVLKALLESWEIDLTNFIVLRNPVSMRPGRSVAGVL
jgi:hypothetical protein